MVEHQAANCLWRVINYDKESDCLCIIYDNTPSYFFSFIRSCSFSQERQFGSDIQVLYFDNIWHLNVYDWFVSRESYIIYDIKIIRDTVRHMTKKVNYKSPNLPQLVKTFVSTTVNLCEHIKKKSFQLYFHLFSLPAHLSTFASLCDLLTLYLPLSNFYNKRQLT